MSLLQSIASRIAVLPAASEESAEKIFFDFGADPVTPPCNDTIPMHGDFCPNVFINGLVQNLKYRNTRLSVDSWTKLINYCNRETWDLSSQIGIQILFLFTKQDINELEKRNIKYDELMDDVVRFLPEFSAEPLGHIETSAVRRFLTKPLIILGFQQCIKEILGSDIVVDDILARISSMNIYKGNSGLPVRGACVYDGVFVNYYHICHTDVVERNKADALTLLCHECSHYLVRVFANNYNFSSPFSNANGEAVKDPVIERKNLEAGRLMELKLFSTQPDWLMSTKEAALSFFLKADSPTETLPFTIAGLMGRKAEAISLSFGIDSPINRFLLE